MAVKTQILPWASVIASIVIFAAILVYILEYPLDMSQWLSLAMFLDIVLLGAGMSYIFDRYARKRRSRRSR